jgi:hypothetical protein
MIEQFHRELNSVFTNITYTNVSLKESTFFSNDDTEFTYLLNYTTQDGESVSKKLVLEGEYEQVIMTVAALHRNAKIARERRLQAREELNKTRAQCCE